MTSNSFSSLEEAECIKKFCRHIIKEKSGNYPNLKRSWNGTIIYQDASGITSNRGNKLLQKSDLVTRQIMNSSKPINEDLVYYNGSEHKLLQRRKRMKFSTPSDDINDHGYQELDEEKAKNDNEDDLSSLVDVRQVLTPISSLSDISKRPPIARAFESSVLTNLALQFILMIEKEQYSVIRYSRLLEMFLGDHSKPLYEQNLRLPIYDHNLSLPDEEDNTDVEEKEKDGAKQEPETPGEDPFFALPKISESNALLQILPEANSPQVADEVETARQLAQIALQRNQEFIRNLKKIRNGLVKANRIKERIHAWSREYVGIQEKDVIVPNVLRVVKRGLISATTNRSMAGRDSNAEEYFEDENEMNEGNE